MRIRNLSEREVGENRTLEIVSTKSHVSKIKTLLNYHVSMNVGTSSP